MKGCLRIVKNVDMVFSGITTKVFKVFILVIGWIRKGMVRESTSYMKIQLYNIKENGLMINIMAMEFLKLKKRALYIKGNGLRAIKKVMEYIRRKMAANMKDNGIRIWNMALENTKINMANMKDNGLKTRNMALENLKIKMANNMMDNGLMTKNMARVLNMILTEMSYIVESGLKIKKL